MPHASSRIIPTLRCALALALAARPAAAQETPEPLQTPAQESVPPRPLIVGTKEAPPFSFRGPDGEWTGISIELWDDMADELGLRYELREASLKGLIAGLTDGTLDVAVAALTVTSERALQVDFTYPFYPSGLGIAVASEGDFHLLPFLGALLSPAFLSAVGTLVVLIFAAGVLVWLFERRRNREQFGGPTPRGLGSAFWWSAVTMTTVGYGDKAPATTPGRAVALIWMFVSIITISTLTAAITSTLTLTQLGTSITGPADLSGMRVGAIEGASSLEWLDGRRIAVSTYPDLPAALQALNDGEVRAVVHDAPLLRYLITERFPDSLTVLPSLFARQDYAIGLPLESEMRKKLNHAILEEIGTEAWRRTLKSYLGEDIEP